MRNTFASEITKLAKEDKEICLLSGDIGNRMFDEFKKIAPQRFINCGIAESNMMSVAAGMALSGLKPIVYTITPFTTIRCLEQIKVGVAYHEAPVIIIGTGSGLSYAELGATHHSLEDIAILRSIPNLDIAAPADSIELIGCLKSAINNKRATYIRIGKKGEPKIHAPKKIIKIGEANFIERNAGSKNIVLSIGPIISEAIDAINILKQKGIQTDLASMVSVKPIDHNFLKLILEKGYENIITLEEHYRNGGLGSTILEWINENCSNKIKIIRMGIDDHFINELGSQDYIRKNESIDSHNIIEVVSSI
tara:strand:+ start:129 stop:1052 length:924 start_codon:yes stop_codon:yes gene_type:complete